MKNPNPLILRQNRPIRRLHRAQPPEIINIGPISGLGVETGAAKILFNPFVTQTIRRESNAVTVLDYGPAPNPKIKIAPFGSVNPNLMRGQREDATLGFLNENGARDGAHVNPTIPQPVNEKRPHGTYYPHFAGIEIRNGEFANLGVPEVLNENLAGFVCEARRVAARGDSMGSGELRGLFGLGNSGILFGGFVFEGEFVFGNEVGGDVLEGVF